MQSASRPPIVGYSKFWQSTVGSKINKFFQTGWGSTVSQSFNWIKRIKLRH